MQLLSRGRARLELDESSAEPSRRDPPKNRTKAFRAFRMVRAGVVTREAVVPAEQHTHRHDGIGDSRPPACKPRDGPWRSTPDMAARPVRWPVVRAQFRDVSRRAGVLVAVVVTVLGTTLFTIAGPGAGLAGATTNTPPQNAVVLESQSPAFVSDQSGVDVGVEVSSKLPASRLELEITLYSKVVSGYTFRQTLSGSLPSFLSPLGDPDLIPLSLKSFAWVSGKRVVLHLPVSAPDLPGAAGSKGDVGTDGVILSSDDCDPGCGGVYPMQVSLLEDNVGPIANLTTDLIVTPPSEVTGTHPVRFAWVMSLGSTAAISPSGAAQLDTSDIDALSTLRSALDAAPKSSVSVEVFPQFVESLEDLNDPAAKNALAHLQALSAPGGPVALLPGPFAPVDLDALVSSGLGDAFATQMARSRSVLTPKLGYQAREFAAFSPIDDASLGLLEDAGITRLIIPSTGVQPLSPTYSQFTPTAPFVIPRSGIVAIASDPGLEEDLASTVSPALKAQQMMANLAVLYFENTEAHQAVAAESPLGSDLNKDFLTALLAGLSKSPVVDAVTLSELFDSVSPGSSESSPPERLLASPAVPTDQLLSLSSVQAAHASLAALASMLPSSLDAKPPLGDLILESECATVPASRREAYLTTIDNQAQRLSDLVSLPFGRTITVTSLQAKIPISIISTATVPLLVELSVTSPDLGFPHGHSWPVTLDPRTNIVTIDLTARESGDFPLTVTLASRTGFVVQSGDITIRSTAISGVAVALSIGAAVFLVVWWLRSILSKRRKKHKLRGAALAAGAIPAPPPVA
jgi:hypothetical protein